MSEQTNFIGLEIKGLKEVKEKLEKLPPEAQDMVVDEVSEYMLNLLREYPPKKSVSRKAAYGVTFFSDKQRRYFFWALHSGRIQVPYKRTQTFRNGWKQVGEGAESLIINEVPYGKFLMSDEDQSMHEFLVGWPIISEVIQDHGEKIVKKAEVGVKKAIKKLDLENTDLQV